MNMTCGSAHSRHLVGDPVDVVSGANTDRARDFVFDGPLPVEFFRFYDSRWCSDDRGLGYGFRHGFEHWLVFDLDGVTYRRPDGHDCGFLHFSFDGQRQLSGGYWLERVNAQRYTLSRAGQPTLVFRRPANAIDGELVEIVQEVDGREHRISLRYDSQGRLDKILAPGDETLHVEWNGEGHIHGVQHWARDGRRAWLIRYTYERGYLVEGEDAYKQSFYLAYDERGRVCRRTDRRGYSFHFEYDRDGRCTASWGDDGVMSVQLTYKPLEYETRVLDANGGEWIYQYTASGVVTFITDPYGGRRYFEIGDDGRLLAEYNERGAQTRYVHDDAGAPIAKVTPDGDTIPLPEPEPRLHPKAHRVPGLPIEWELGDLWDTDLGADRLASGRLLSLVG
jgi:YD repeat-containing protein